MAENEKVLMLVTRRYPRKDHTYGVGESDEFPEHVAAAMESANPPYGKRISEQQLEQITDPAAPDATEGARALAKDAGVSLAVVTGTGEGGRITKADVQTFVDAAGG